MIPESLNSAIKAFFIGLEQLSKEFEEVTDTDVRESLHLVLNYCFVWGKELDQLPVSYGMFTLEGDQSVAQVVSTFLSSASSLSDIPVGIERLNLLQNREIRTPEGCQYDDFIGHVDEPLFPDELPKDLFEEDDYDDQPCEAPQKGSCELNSIPDDETGNALRRFQSNGIDLSKPLIMDFFVAVPSKKTGDQVAAKVKRLGFKPSVEQDDETGDWTCYCTKTLIPEYSEVVKIEKELDNIARPQGGFSDGFGSYGQELGDKERKYQLGTARRFLLPDTEQIAYRV